MDAEALKDLATAPFILICLALIALAFYLASKDDGGQR